MLNKNFTLVESPTIKSLRDANLSLLKKKKVKKISAIDWFNASKGKSREHWPLLPLLVAIKLIIPGKRKFKILANGLKSIPRKHIYKITY